MSDQYGNTCPNSPPATQSIKYLTSAHPAGYDYDAAYDDEYPPQQPYPHPGIRGLQVTKVSTTLTTQSVAVRRGRKAVRGRWVAKPAPMGLRGGGLRRRIRRGRGGRARQQGWVSLTVVQGTEVESAL